MDWMSNLFAALLLTTITGTIFYLAGIPFRKIWFRRDIRLLRIQMRMTQGAFMIPFVYIVLYLRERIKMPFARNRTNLFYHTPATLRICIGLGCLWGLLFLTLLGYKLYRRWRWMMVCRGNIPEEDMEISALFSEICGQLGVSGRVSLCRNDSVDMPCITYSHGFTVVLPLYCYTKKEAAIIFYHELCHYLNGDIYLKTVSCIAALLHVFNPAVHAALCQLSLACEEYCDRMACLRGAGVFSEKEYFLTILRILTDGGKRERYDLLTLADTIGEYERRVQCMREYHVSGGIKKRAAILLAASFLLGSSVTALAAGDGVTEAYGAVADVTETRTEESANSVDAIDAASELSDEEVLEEFARMYDLDPDDVIMLGEDDIELIGTTLSFKRNDLEPGKTYMSSGFSQEVGDSLYVSTVGSPSDVKYQMGIKDPNQLMRYVENSGNFSHTFDITIKGRYYFFATNMDSSRNLTVTASIIR